MEFYSAKMAFSTQIQGSLSIDSSYDVNLISELSLISIGQPESGNGVNTTIRAHSDEQDGTVDAIKTLY